jgi:DNA-binding response OmpR family regulator
MRILVVEDEMTIAFLLEDMIEDLGHQVAGVAMRLEPAREAARSLEIDMALLDVNLDGLRSFPVADILRERGIPFAFLTGYGPGAIPAEYASEPLVTKPVSREALRKVISGLW